jgi:hypothetical protein
VVDVRPAETTRDEHRGRWRRTKLVAGVPALWLGRGLKHRGVITVRLKLRGGKKGAR